HKPYADDPHRRGQLIRLPRELAALLARVHEAGFQLAVHAIGDRAVDVVLDAYERILDEDSREDHRHRMEHLELTSEDALDRVADLGVLPSMQPNFVARWSHPGGMYEARLGRSRVREINLYRELLRRGSRVAFGSDGMPYGPLYGMRGAMEAPFPSQRLRFRDALRCYTVHGAFAGFEEGDKGTLAAGKLADFVVLSGVPGRVPGSRVRVVATAVGGRLVYGRPPAETSRS
ncbi:MAG: amidohydrolase family protein, partial [Euryarchaeota archaeon]|nr:amidohydrolase family protein [Euryarchaeota archaeon]